MNEFEATKLGYSFTGVTWRSWDKDEEKMYKDEAAALKKKYKGIEYRIVTGTARGWLSTGSKGIWANDVYCKVQYYKDDTLEIELANIEAEKRRLEEQLVKLEQRKLAAIALDNEIKSLLKN